MQLLALAARLAKADDAALERDDMIAKLSEQLAEAERKLGER